MVEYIEREAVVEAIMNQRLYYTFGDPNSNQGAYNMVKRVTLLDAVKRIPDADVPSALWTDEPISGTEFMTHNQGQSGFEIHFRTDDKAKYEAVQDECRRQIDHAKPAADVRPVARGKWIDHQEGRWIYAKCSECGTVHDVKSNFCPNCGSYMRLREEETE